MEKFVYQTIDNSILQGILEKNSEQSDSCVILCHGIRVDKEELGNFTALAKNLLQENIDSFRFDFRGQGESNMHSIHTTISGEIVDLETTISFVSKLGYEKIIVLGASFGGGITGLIDYTKFPEVVGFIFWYPCLNYTNVSLFSKEKIEIAVKKGYYRSERNRTEKEFDFGKQLMLETLTYKPYENLKNNVLPKLFIHGKADIEVPCIDTIQVAKTSPNAELILIPNGTHGFFNDKELFDKVIKYSICYIKKVVKDE